MTTEILFRAAKKSDVAHLSRMLAYASEGLAPYYWQTIADDGQDPWEMGRTRCLRKESSCSYTNTTVAEINGKYAGSLSTYLIDDVPEPIDLETMPSIFIPIQELEDLAPSTQYVSVLAMYPDYRGHGIGSTFLAQAEKAAAGRTMSLVVSDGNPGAHSLYKRSGYREHASRKMIKEHWNGEGENWILMLK